MRYFINLVLTVVGGSSEGHNGLKDDRPFRSSISTTTPVPSVTAISIESLLSAGRYEEAIESVTQAVLIKSISQIFSDEESDRILRIFKSGINYEREMLKRYNRALTTSGAAGGRLRDAADETSRSISAELLKRYCIHLIEILSNQLNLMDPHHYAGLHRARTNAIIGDMYRYISEVSVGEDQKWYQENSLARYTETLRVYYSAGVAPDDMERIRVQTNRELIMFAIPRLRHEAISSLGQTIREVEREYNKPWSRTTQEQRDFVRILEARFELWNDQLNDEEWVVL
jgi:hypothetical protein